MKYPVWVQTKSHKRMHDDFKVFLYWLWKQLDLPPPTTAQYEMADYLQHGPKRRIIMAFRGVGKSWITAAFVIWCLMRNPQEKIMVVSASEYKATEFSTFTKQLISTLPLLSWLLPHKDDGQRDSVLAFDVGPATPAQAPSVRAAGIGGQLAGGRATKVIFDDIEVPNNSETEGKRDKLEYRSRELGGAILVPGGESIGLGTPQSVQTVYNRFEQRGYEIRVWPARYPNEKDLVNYGDRLAPGIVKRLLEEEGIVGNPTDPARFDEDDLLEREAEYGRSGFALQFMLDTTLSDANKYPLKLHDLIVMDVDTEIAPSRVTWASGKQQIIEGVPNVGMNGDRYYAPMHISDDFKEYESSVLYVDPAGRGRDETAYAVVKQMHGLLYVRRWGGLSGGYDMDTLKALANIAKEEKVKQVCIESNFGDGMFNSLFAPVLTEIYPVTLEEYKVMGQKELRIIDKLEPILNQHRLIMDKSLVENQLSETPQDAGERKRLYNGFYQLAFMTKDRGSLKQDDRIDVLAEAVGHFTLQVDRDVETAERKSKDRALERALMKHQKSCRALTGVTKRKRWAG
jgi:hypothetical protein